MNVLLERTPAKTAALALMMAIPFTCHSKTDFSALDFRAFGTLAAGKTDSEDTFIDLDYSDGINFRNKSIFGLQLQLDINENLSATVQAISKGQEDYNTEFDWAYISYDFTNNNRINIGHLRLPFFRYAESVNVGYALPFAYAPDAVYSLPFNTFDGISYLHSYSLDQWDIHLNVLYGSSNPQIWQTDVTAHDITGFSLELGNNSTSLNFSGIWFLDSTVPLAPAEELATQLQALGESEDDIEKIRFEGDSPFYGAVGFSQKINQLFFLAEASIIESKDSFLADGFSWYAMLGYKTKKNFQPYIMVEDRQYKRNTSTAGHFSPAVQPIVQSFFDAFIIEYKGYSLGFKYSIDTNAAVKFQFSHFYDVVDRSVDFGTLDDKESLNQIVLGLDFYY